MRTKGVVIVFAVMMIAMTLGAQCTIPTVKESGTSSAQPLILSNFVSLGAWVGPIFATNLAGTPTWSNCPKMMLTRPATASTILVLGAVGTDFQVQELNTAGTIVWSVSMNAVNAQLSGFQIRDFNHEAIRLPNGWTAIVTHMESLENCSAYPSQCGGATTGTVDILGSGIVVVDQVGTVRWSWNPFTQFDLNRVAILGETCSANTGYNGGCPIQLAPVANDWMHGNSLYFDPVDGGLLFNLRDQDWALKLAYADGLGDGHIIWHLGQGGDFHIVNSPGIIWPWFSHAHDITMTATGSGIYTVFDNGNTRVATYPTMKSRGQSLSVNETTMQVDVIWSVNLPLYSPALGTAQLLSNGDYWFLLGIPTNPNTGTVFSEGVEYTPAKVLVFSQSSTSPRYRAPRLATLFSTN